MPLTSDFSRVPDEADAEQPEREQAVGLAGQQLQGTLLTGLVRAVAERDLDGQPADQDVDDAASGETDSGERFRGWAVCGTARAPGGARRL
jgi:hypothetical protein